MISYCPKRRFRSLTIWPKILSRDIKYQIIKCAVKFVLPQTRVKRFDNLAKNIVARYKYQIIKCAVKFVLLPHKSINLLRAIISINDMHGYISTVMFIKIQIYSFFFFLNHIVVDIIIKVIFIYFLIKGR